MKKALVLLSVLFIVSFCLSFFYTGRRNLGRPAANGSEPFTAWVDADGDGKPEKLVFDRASAATDGGEYDRMQIYERGMFGTRLVFDSRAAGLDIAGTRMDLGGPCFRLEDGDGNGRPEICLQEEEADGGPGRVAIIEGGAGRYEVLFYGVLADRVYEDLDDDGRRELHGCTGDTVGDLLFPLLERTVFIRTPRDYRPSVSLTRRLAEREMKKAAGDFLAAPTEEKLFVLVNYYAWLGLDQEAATLIKGGANLPHALDGTGVPVEYYLEDLEKKMAEYEAWWAALQREE